MSLPLLPLSELTDESDFAGPKSEMPQVTDDYLVWPASMEKTDMPLNNVSSWSTMKGTTSKYPALLSLEGEAEKCSLL
jgi:hypothetical protein